MFSTEKLAAILSEEGLFKKGDASSSLTEEDLRKAIEVAFTQGRKRGKVWVDSAPGPGKYVFSIRNFAEKPLLEVSLARGRAKLTFKFKGDPNVSHSFKAAPPLGDTFLRDLTHNCRKLAKKAGYPGFDLY